jgi:hypothetical protein
MAGTMCAGWTTGGPAPLPDLQHEALAEGAGPPNSHPRPSRYDRELAPHGGGEPSTVGPVPALVGLVGTTVVLLKPRVTEAAYRRHPVSGS